MGITTGIPARILTGIMASGTCCIELKCIILSVIPAGMPAVGAVILNMVSCFLIQASVHDSRSSNAGKSIRMKFLNVRLSVGLLSRSLNSEW